METRKQIAADKKRCNSHNCAQAILHTYADIAGISEDEAMNIAGAVNQPFSKKISKMADFLLFIADSEKDHAEQVAVDSYGLPF